MAGVVQAAPSGGQVVAGQATISASGGKTVISQSSGKAIVDWTDFSIGQGGEVDFNNGSGATLNRVTGKNLSSIDGLLKATGSVYLINPNGVIIGKTGQVRVGGDFVASALDVSNANFLSGGDLTFSGPSLASVVNLGKIGALGGDVSLMAVNVRNSGEIDAANGAAGLIAGHDIILRDSSVNDGRFLIVTGGADTAATNDGDIAAAAAELRAEGGNVYALAGNTHGVIRATGVADKGGKIWLTAGDAGSVAVSGSALTAADGAGNGGAITVTGGHVQVAADARLDASATKDGGRGGAISVIADKTGGDLSFAGTALARGDLAGGQVETSGASVNFDGARIDTSARNGLSGDWLVDPYDLTVNASAASTISSNLATTNVTLQTTASGTSGPGTANASGNGDIFVNSDISWSSGNSLTLDAYRSVAFNANVTATGSGGAVIKTNDGGSGGDYTFAQGKSLSLTTSGSLSINGASYSLINSMSGLTSLGSGNYALSTNLTGGSYSNALTSVFRGVLTGLGHTINALAINNSSGNNNFGLVGENDGTIRDLGMTNVSFTITNGGDATGAIAGYNAPNAVIRNVWATGTVSGGDIGGLVGDNDGYIYTSYSAVTVTGSGDAGGLSGENYGVISNTYATGSVHGGHTSGGLVGDDGNDSYGADGSGANSGLITYSYATGAVSGMRAGGLTGANSSYYASGTITNSYWNTTTSGQSSSAGGTGMTTSQLQNGSLPTGFSSSVWTVSSGAYPQLSSFIVPVVPSQTVGGTIYASNGSAASGATVTLYSGGSLIGTSAASASDGTYSVSLADGTITSSTALGGLLTLSGASSVSGLIYTNAPTLTGGNVAGFDLHAGLIDLTTGASGYIALQSLLNTTFGSSNLSSALAAISNPDYKITASGAFTLDGNLTGGGAVSIKSGGDLTIANPVTVSGSKALTLDAHDNLYVNANLTASGADAVSLTTSDGGSGDYYFALGDSLSFTGSGASLNINGNTYTLVSGLSGLATLNGATGYYALAGDIDAASAGTQSGSVIGSFGSSASDTFTGLGHSISNLVISNSSSTMVGLFGQVHGTIRDTGVVGGSVTGTHSGAYVGGLVGHMLSGYAYNNFSTATVTGTNGNVGGLVGYSDYSTIQNSFATGAVTGATNSVGGLIGTANGSTVKNTYATGVVTGSGGAASLGGLVGSSYTSTSINNSFATGAVINNGGSANAGGLAGGLSSSSVTNGYYDSNTSGMSDTHATSQTTAQLQGALPSGFSSSVWSTGAGLYPYLKTFYPNGVQAISGTATDTSGSAVAAAGIGVYAGGALLGNGSSGVNGYYYLITEPGTVTSSTGLGAALTLKGASDVTGLSYTDAPALSSGNVTGFDIRSGLIDATTAATSYSGLQSALSSAFGSTTLSAISANIGSLDYKIDASGAFTLDSDLTGGGAVSIKSGGDLTIANPVTVSGSKALTLDAHDNLYVNANLTASGADAVSLTTSDGGSGDYYFALGDSLSFTGSGASLNINGSAYTLLYAMADLPSMNNSTGKFALAKSLDASSNSYTASVIANFSSNSNHGGIFSGLGNTISNLKITVGGSSNTGLFGFNFGTVRDIGLIGGLVQGQYVGSLVGYNYGGVIKNAYSSATVKSSLGGSAGGLVEVNSGTLTNSFATGSVSGASTSGGLVAANYNSSGVITNSFATGPVSASAQSGGLVGINNGGSIADSFATGYVTGGGGKGGLAGNAIGGAINNSYYDVATTGGGNALGSSQTTAQLQGALPSGFSSSVWATGAGLYPYLKTFYPNGEQAITGALTDNGAASAAGAKIDVYQGGGLLATGFSGANGVYYLSVASGSVTTTSNLGGALTLSGSANASGVVYNDARSLTNGNVSDLNAQAGLVDAATTATSYGGLQTALSNTFGNTALSAISTGIGSPNYKINAAGALNFDQSASFSAGLDVTAGGGITFSQNLTTAGATRFNSAVTLGADVSINSGVGALTFASTIDGAHSLNAKGASLTFGGPVGASSHLTSLTGTATLGGIAVGGQITTTGDIVLAANGGFTNTAGASALNPGGAFTVYTQDAADPTGTMPTNSLGGLSATNYYNDAYDFSAGTFASAVPTGNHFVYAYAASLTPTLSGSTSKTYDAGLTADTSGLSLDPGTLLSAGDSVTLSISGASYSDKNAGTGKTVTADVAFASNPNNYTLSSTTAAAAIGVINKAALTLAAATDTKTYDATTTSTSAVGVTDLQGSDTVTGLSQSFDSKNAGGRTLGVNAGYTVNDGNSGGNYTVTTQDASGTITKAALTLAAVTDTKTYDASTSSTGSVNVTGLQGSDTVTGLTQSFDSKNAGSRTLSVGGGYSVNDGNSGGNYTVTTQDASGTINKAALTLAAATDTKTYDATTSSTGTVGVTGLQGSDTVTGLTQSFDSRNAGSRTLSVGGGYSVNDGNSGGNYTVTTQTASGTIAKAALTLAAATDTKTYDATTSSTASVGVTGLQGSDTVTGLTQSYDSKNAGSRTLSVGAGYTVNDGNSGGNYRVTTQTASGTIAKAALT
ncbi:MAG: beta strand repeat-containing protein, partial [Asticcacaulis sp.]|uniref:beta strand repeat-containing protein n=1 Tax=Asticcacaulis sp. TaxID=1872648 RepID=UPI003F7C45A2